MGNLLDDLVEDLDFLDLVRSGLHLKLLEIVAGRIEELPVWMLAFVFCIFLV